MVVQGVFNAVEISAEHKSCGVVFTARSLMFTRWRLEES